MARLGIGFHVGLDHRGPFSPKFWARYLLGTVWAVVV